MYDFNFEKLCTPEFTIGNTKFMIHKLTGFEGFRVLESLREKLAEAVASIDFKTEEDVKKIFINIMRMPASYIEGYLIPSLFCNVSYANPSAPNFMPIKGMGAIDMAFEKLEPTDIYEVLLRALCINFYQSFKGKVSAFFDQKKVKR